VFLPASVDVIRKSRVLGAPRRRGCDKEGIRGMAQANVYRPLRSDAEQVKVRTL
jgi:hypothetical protein